MSGKKRARWAQRKKGRSLFPTVKRQPETIRDQWACLLHEKKRGAVAGRESFCRSNSSESFTSHSVMPQRKKKAGDQKKGASPRLSSDRGKRKKTTGWNLMSIAQRETKRSLNCTLDEENGPKKGKPGNVCLKGEGGDRLGSAPL